MSNFKKNQINKIGKARKKEPQRDISIRNPLIGLYPLSESSSSRGFYETLRLTLLKLTNFGRSNLVTISEMGADIHVYTKDKSLRKIDELFFYLQENLQDKPFLLARGISKGIEESRIVGPCKMALKIVPNKKEGLLGILGTNANSKSLLYRKTEVHYTKRLLDPGIRIVRVEKNNLGYLSQPF